MMRKTLWVGTQVLAFLSGMPCTLCFSAGEQHAASATKRPIKIADAVEMTRLADSDYLVGAPFHVAHFSPDGKQFFIALRKGSLAQNTNEFSLYVFQCSEVFNLGKPVPLVTMSSSSNRDAIANAKWLGDNETIVFLGENRGEVSQVYAVNAGTKLVKKLTNDPMGIVVFDITRDGHEIIYMANAPHTKPSESDPAQDQGTVIAGQNLFDILAGNYAVSDEHQIFLQEPDHSPVLAQTKGYVTNGELLLSPNGQSAIVGVVRRDIPSAWEQYDGFIHHVLAANVPRGTVAPFPEYLLVDATGRALGPLVSAPADDKPIWADDSKSIFLKTYLPLDVSNTAERAAREKSSYAVEVKLPSREFRKLGADEWPKEPESKAQLEVSLKEDLNTPQRVYASDPRTQRRALLFDLGAQFDDLDLGRVETIEWELKDEVKGRLKVLGGLYFPPDYQTGRRYSLVIQTHGFEPREFSTDGAREWASGYAARPLAAKGFLVLQEFGFKSRDDHDRYKDKMQFGHTEEQAARNINVAAIEGAIDYLDGRGMIDRERVGIVGFSRTVGIVAYMLTHSLHQFAAASLVDGFDYGYFQAMAFPYIAWDVDSTNGGAQPFGEGLQTWLRESPSFSLDKVRTPVRLLALGTNSVLEGWEWYAGLSMQKKPVDFVLLPDAVHLIAKPRERLAAQQGLVDWFTFWLQNEEDPDPGKAEQYARWRELRKMQQENDTKDKTAKRD